MAYVFIKYNGAHRLLYRSNGVIIHLLKYIDI